MTKDDNISIPRLAIDVGGVISTDVDTDKDDNNNTYGACELLNQSPGPTWECIKAVRLLVERFGRSNTFILSKCRKRETMLATVDFLSRNIIVRQEGNEEKEGKEGNNSGNFFDRTNLDPHNVLFCTRRSGMGSSDDTVFDSSDGLIRMESLVKSTSEASSEKISNNQNRTKARVTVGENVGKGAVARKFGLTHFIDDRSECLLSEMFEGCLFVERDNNNKIDGGSGGGGALIQFVSSSSSSSSKVPDADAVSSFLDSHSILPRAGGGGDAAEENNKKRQEAVDSCLAKWVIAKGWNDVLRALVGIHQSSPTIPPSNNSSSSSKTTRRLTPKLPSGWEELSADQKRVFESLVRTINQEPVEQTVDKLYNAIPDSFGGRVIGTDAARELSDEYRLGGWEGKLLYSQVTSGPASKYAQDRFRREIEKKDTHNTVGGNDRRNRRRVLVLTAGGPASGKTSVVRSDLVNGEVDLVMDQNLGKYDRAIEQIELALANDWDVRVVYVFKPIELFAAKVFDRANSHGRWAPASVVGRAHITAQESVVKLYDRYMSCSKNGVDLRNDDNDSQTARVHFRFVENLHTKDNPVPCVDISVDDIRPGGRCNLGDKKELVEEEIRCAMLAAKESRKMEPRLMAAMEFGTNPATGK